MARRGRVDLRSGLLLLGLLLLAGSPAEAQGPIINGCQDSQYLDRTAPAADREILWVMSVNQDPERCMKVRVGQSVFWNGNYSIHPLAGLNGDSPNPIDNHQNGHVTFTSAGTFGFVCEVHATMTGAIRVLPAVTTSVPGLPPAFAVGLAIVLLAAGVRLLRGRSRAV